MLGEDYDSSGWVEVPDDHMARGLVELLGVGDGE